MLTLKELRFKGIGRFVEEQTINFETLGNLIQVDGLNKNTGGLLPMSIGTMNLLNGF